MFIRLRSVFTGSWGGGAAYGNCKARIKSCGFIFWRTRRESPAPSVVFLFDMIDAASCWLRINGQLEDVCGLTPHTHTHTNLTRVFTRPWMVVAIHIWASVGVVPVKHTRAHTRRGWKEPFRRQQWTFYSKCHSGHSFTLVFTKRRLMKHSIPYGRLLHVGAEEVL